MDEVPDQRSPPLTRSRTTQVCLPVNVQRLQPVHRLPHQACCGLSDNSWKSMLHHRNIYFIHPSSVTLFSHPYLNYQTIKSIRSNPPQKQRGDLHQSRPTISKQREGSVLLCSLAAAAKNQEATSRVRTFRSQPMMPHFRQFPCPRKTSHSFSVLAMDSLEDAQLLQLFQKRREAHLSQMVGDYSSGLTLGVRYKERGERGRID